MNILELPKEILSEIWSFVTRIDDIIRFGSTCKRVQSLAFEPNRNLYIDDQTPIAVLKDIFSRDLRHLRKLNFTPSKCTKEEADWIIDTLTILSTLHNLKKLYCRFHAISADPVHVAKILDKLSLITQKMTWLEVLDTSFNDVENYGSLFKDHMRLTKIVMFNGAGNGIGELQRLRSLTLPISAKKDFFNEALKLTNLTALDFSWTETSLADVKEISKLTNLEKINASGSHEKIPGQIYLSLSKLRSLETDYYSPSTPFFEEFGRSMTQLTRLHLFGWGCSISAEKLSYMTNLQSLNFDITLSNPADFEAFQKLTKLKISTASADVDQVQFPRGLKILECAFKLGVFDADSLEELTLTSQVTGSECLKISRLTNLKFLSFTGELPVGAGNSLKMLPMLRTLRLHEISPRDISELKVVTQLCQLELMSNPDGLKEGLTWSVLRQQLPFAVYNS